MEMMYCALERPESIPTKRFNRNEGRCSYATVTKRVQAFKAGQVRVYGVEGSVFGIRSFFAAVVATKKTQKLNPRNIQLVEKRIATVSSIRGAAL